MGPGDDPACADARREELSGPQVTMAMASWWCLESLSFVRRDPLDSRRLLISPPGVRPRAQVVSGLWVRARDSQNAARVSLGPHTVCLPLGGAGSLWWPFH